MTSTLKVKHVRKNTNICISTVLNLVTDRDFNALHRNIHLQVMLIAYNPVYLIIFILKNNFVRHILLFHLLLFIVTYMVSYTYDVTCTYTMTRITFTLIDEKNKGNIIFIRI